MMMEDFSPINDVTLKLYYINWQGTSIISFSVYFHYHHTSLIVMGIIFIIIFILAFIIYLFFLSLNNLLLCETQSDVSDSVRLHGLYSPSNSPGQNTGVGSHSLLQGIFPTQGSNPGLLHCRWIPYQLSHHYCTWVLTLCLCMVLQATQASFHSALQRKQLASF